MQCGEHAGCYPWQKWTATLCYTACIFLLIRSSQWVCFCQPLLWLLWLHLVIKLAFQIWWFGGFFYLFVLLLFLKKYVPDNRYSAYTCARHWWVLLASQAPVATSWRYIKPFQGVDHLWEKKVNQFVLFHCILQQRHGFCSDLWETA